MKEMPDVKGGFPDGGVREGHVAVVVLELRLEQQQGTNQEDTFLIFLSSQRKAKCKDTNVSTTVSTTWKE